MYANGRGVTGDTVITYVWVNLAGANGSDATQGFVRYRPSVLYASCFMA